MPEKKQESFTVTDRRMFTPDGELRNDSVPEESRGPTAASPTSQPVASPGAASPAPDVPPAPTAAAQREQAEAYRRTSKEMDRRVELSGHSAKELEMTFERFLASFYMTAMVQLGLMHEQGGQPRVDLIGARQTIDTLALLQEKTKGNLTATEENFLQNCLYELRMTYVEVTNALSRAPAAPAGTAKS